MYEDVSVLFCMCSHWFYGSRRVLQSTKDQTKNPTLSLVALYMLRLKLGGRSRQLLRKIHHRFRGRCFKNV